MASATTVMNQLVMVPHSVTLTAVMIGSFGLIVIDNPAPLGWIEEMMMIIEKIKTNIVIFKRYSLALLSTGRIEREIPLGFAS